MRRLLALLALVLVAGAPRNAHALGPLDVLAPEDAREVRVDTGLATSVVGWLAYGQRLPRLGERELAFEARLGLPVVSPDLGDLGLEGGVQLDVFAVDRWRLRNQLDLGVRTVDNGVFYGVELALRDTVSFGWFGRHGRLGLDLGWEQGLATHIHHSDWYRTNVYPDAQDGWIAFPVGRLRLGLYAGVAPTRRLLIALRVGTDRDRTGRPDFVPLVALLSAAWSF